MGTVTQSDRIFATVLAMDQALEYWTLDDVMEGMGILFDDSEDLPTRRTVRGRLAGLADLGVLISLGGGGRTYRRFRIADEWGDQITVS